MTATTKPTKAQLAKFEKTVAARKRRIEKRAAEAFDKHQAEAKRKAKIEDAKSKAKAKARTKGAKK